MGVVVAVGVEVGAGIDEMAAGDVVLWTLLQEASKNMPRSSRQQTERGGSRWGRKTRDRPSCFSGV